MAQEETKVKVTYDVLKPFIVEVGKKIHDMLFEAQIKHGNRCRRTGICTEMLNATQCVLKRPYTIVYVDEWAPEYVRNMYRKRGYVIQQN